MRRPLAALLTGGLAAGFLGVTTPAAQAAGPTDFSHNGVVTISGADCSRRRSRSPASPA